MIELRKALIATILHVVELAVCLIGSLALMRYFELSSDQMAIVIGIAVNALAKFARSHPQIPLSDYTR